jgi:electron transport complex protein RnfG
MLRKRIAANKLTETYKQIPALVPGGDTAGGIKEIGEFNVYSVLDADGEFVGWVVPTSGQGFADRIEILLGLNADATKITGIYVLDQKETPGLGNKIVEEKWRAQFAGKATERPLIVTKSPPQGEFEVQAVTGATISSDSVTETVNKTVEKFRKALKGEGK